MTETERAVAAMAERMSPHCGLSEDYLQESLTKVIEWPRRAGKSRLMEMQERINESFKRSAEWMSAMAFMVQEVKAQTDAQYREVTDVAQKAWHVSQRDDVQRIGAHAAWCRDLECSRRWHPDWTFRGEPIRPFALVVD